MKLQGYITELLRDHNCVIVPDFGGFVANYKSAVIDEHRKKIHPPSKSVLFNPHLVTNDGLLGNFISQKERIEYPHALNFISNGVSDWKKSFEKGDRIEIGEIGFLFQENGNIHFEQSREVNLLLQAFGLRSVDFVKFSESSLPKTSEKKVEETFVQKDLASIETTEVKEEPIQKEKPVKIIELIDETPVQESSKEVKEPVAVEEEKLVDPEKESMVIALNQEEQIKDIKKKKRAENNIVPIKRNVTKTVIRYAIAAAIVPVLFYSYWIPMETDALATSSIQLTDFNPIHEQAKRSYQQRDSEIAFEAIDQPENWDDLTENIDASVYNFELSEDFYVPISLEKANSPIENGEQNNEFATNNNVNGNYHVIAGCFSVKENANNLVKSLQSQGFSAVILDKSGGLTRVSAGGYNDREAANEGLNKLKDLGNSGWILKK